ncbi:MAG TPA: M23 family metallopeptidase [Thermoanaerobaculia bacterium]|nr:M23 family metallopeptidase [Thermoanaerobaculia bacterium]
MIKALAFSTALAAGLAAQAPAQVVIREFHVTPIVRPDVSHEAHDRSALRAATESLRGETNALDRLKLYPVAGVLNRDFYIPYFVDLQPGPGLLDYRCMDYTFEEHTGHDPYIRSFREQEIGVPVFAPLDATVLEVHDGEPDQNTVVDFGAPSNFVVLSHVSGYRTEYMHLKRGSVTVQPGQTVTAGTQIGMVGSSGPSAAPHVHFETRVNNEPVEPLAGPCRAGASLFERQQPDISVAPVVIGVSFSDRAFSAFQGPPHDNAPRSATYPRNTQDVHFRVEVAEVRAGSTYTLTVIPPSGPALPPVSGTLTAYNAYLASAAWALQVPLTQSGTWHINLRVNGHQVIEVPFTVVDFLTQIVNRPPNPITASIEPVGLMAREVAVCRATGSVLADPDTDVVSYRYQWLVNGELVRDVTTAVRADALASQHAAAGNEIQCRITPSDGQLEAATAVATVGVQGPPRRRAAGR